MANTKKYVSLDKLGLYDGKIKKVISDGDAAALQSAKDYAKEYADGLATNYDVAGAAATVQGKLDEEVLRAKAAEEANAAAAKNAQDEVDALEEVVDTKAAQADLEALAGKVGVVEDGKTVVGMITEMQSGNNTVVEGIQGQIDTLNANKADKTQVALDIAAAVKVEEDARKEAVQAVQDELDGFEADYAEDKEALEGAIALKADQTALDDVSAVANAAVKQSDYDAKVEALEAEDVRIAGLVEDEAERAALAEAGLDERLEKVEAFFVGAAEDEGEGENLKNALDTLVEIQTYIDNDGAAADQMVKDIAANKKAIEDHAATNHDFAGADAALKSELEGKINAKADASVVEAIDDRLEAEEGKVATLQGEMAQAKLDIDAVEEAVATKVEQEAYNTKVAALEQADAGQVERIAALEAKFGEGEGNVEDMIADAKQEAIDAAALDATSKANTAEANAIAKANELNGAMNTRVEALEAVDHTHANKDLLDTYTQTEANLADAVAKKHAHSNMDVLEAITAAKVAAWDAAEQAAKTYADGLNSAMDTRMVAVETWQANMLECSEEDINGLFA